MSARQDAASAAAAVAAPWTGAWVADRLDVVLETVRTPVGVGLDDLVGLAVRNNPRRAHLLVSTVLGKHVPADPRLVYGSGRALGVLVARALEHDGVPLADARNGGDRRGSVAGAAVPGAAVPGAASACVATAGVGRSVALATGTPDAGAASRVVGPRLGQRRRTRRIRDALTAAVRGDSAACRRLLASTRGRSAPATERAAPLVLGYAETATGLGHAVADALHAPYLHSTRRPAPELEVQRSFEEVHSHASTHLVLPADPSLLRGDGPLVLVDDELSTGNTVLNTIAELHAGSARTRYVIATLVDLRGDVDRARMADAADRLGARIDVVALASGRIAVPPDILDRGQQLVAACAAAGAAPVRPVRSARTAVATARPVLSPSTDVVSWTGLWPRSVREGGRHGFTPDDQVALSGVAASVAQKVLTELVGDDVLVLGSEELMYAPLRVAVELADLLEDLTPPGSRLPRVRFSSTTRSPVLAVDDPGYAIRTALVFDAHDEPADGVKPRFAYNVAPAQGQRGFSDIVLVIDEPGDTAALYAEGGLVPQLARCCRRVHLVVIPAHPPLAAGPGQQARPTRPLGGWVR